jgi:hypothetical protein
MKFWNVEINQSLSFGNSIADVHVQLQQITSHFGLQLGVFKCVNRAGDNASPIDATDVRLDHVDFHSIAFRFGRLAVRRTNRIFEGVWQTGDHATCRDQQCQTDSDDRGCSHLSVHQLHLPPLTGKLCLAEHTPTINIVDIADGPSTRRNLTIP